MYNILMFALAGLLLSVYASHVESSIKKNRKFKPKCDINSNISCSKAFSSPTGKLLGFPNAYLGILFYSIIALLTLFNQTNLIFLASIPAVALSLFLAYISYVKMKNFCLVCTAIYLINILILILSI